MVTFSGKYIVRNKKKTSVIVFALAFGVLLMMLTNTVISSINDNVSAVWAEPLRHFSVVRQLSDQAEITPTDEMKPIVLEKIFITGVTGRISTHCFFTDTGTRDEICKLNHVTLTAGKMPETGTNQIAVSEEIAKNKKLKVGDIIGTSVDPTEGLIGSYEISGLFASDGIFSLGDGSYYLKQMRNPKHQHDRHSDVCLYCDSVSDHLRNLYLHRTAEAGIRHHDGDWLPQKHGHQPHLGRTCRHADFRFDSGHCVRTCDSGSTERMLLQGRGTGSDYSASVLFFRSCRTHAADDDLFVLYHLQNRLQG